MKIAASLATIKERAESLEKTLESLAKNKEIDIIYVMADYMQPKEFDKVDWLPMSNRLGDARKFFPYCNGEKADLWLFCDDDLIYPQNYAFECKRISTGWKDCVWSYHGRTIKPRPLELPQSYYRQSRIEGYRCLFDVDGYHRVDPNGTLGTGVMFFKSGVLKITWDMFKSANMADIWLTKFAVEQKKEMIVVPHKEGWIKHTMNDKTIFEWHQWNDEEQTKLYNSIK